MSALYKVIEMVKGNYEYFRGDSDEVAHEAVADLERMTAESEGRRIALLEKAEEVRREWTRAENAEAERDQWRNFLFTIIAPDGFGQFGEWEGCPICEGHTEHTEYCELKAALHAAEAKQ